MNLYLSLCEKCSWETLFTYSTSFSTITNLLHKDLRQPVANIYAFCRLADEIVDTFTKHNSEKLLAEFKTATFQAISRGISVNPILHSFQLTVHGYGISMDLINAVFHSMEMDLHKKYLNEAEFKEYIYGSAQAVGLMVLATICEKDKILYNDLKPIAERLGAALQKVNFLRDIKQDVYELGRNYFPACNIKNMSVEEKYRIESDIQKDFDEAFKYISRVPVKGRAYLYVMYKYFMALFRKIQQTTPDELMEGPVKISILVKCYILLEAKVKSLLNIL